MKTPTYRIYAMSNQRDYSLYIDYLLQDVESHRRELLDCLQRKSRGEPAFQQWLKNLKPYDVFEIECVDQYEAAKEAVDFWRTYFRSYGEIIVNDRHFIDRLS